MALTLVEAAKYSNDILQAGALELIVREDPIFEKLGFVDILGNGLTYNVETTEAEAKFYDVGDTWIEGTHTITSTTATLKILGGDADVDKFLLATRSNINDLKQEVIAAKVKAIKKTYMDACWRGHTALDAKGFNGLHKLIESATYNTHAIGTATGIEKLLLMSELEEGVDKVKVNKPQLMVMTKAMRRAINKYLRGVGGVSYRDAANGRIQDLFGVDVAVSEYLTDTENCTKEYATGEWGYQSDSAATDTATTIFILSFDPKACTGVQQGPLTIEDLGTLETKDAYRFRIKWYASIMLQNILTCTKVTGILPSGTVAS